MGRVRPEPLIRRALFIVAATLLAFLPACPQDSVIRVNVRLVRLLATVRTAAGELVGNLSKSDFTVFDNGVKQDIAVFERQTEQPLSVAVLLDTSGSTGIEIKYEIDSVNRFLRALVSEGNPDDAAALYTFNWEVRLLSDYTRRIARLEQRLKQVKSEGGTSMYDAIYLASQELTGREGRHVIVLVTDGGDTTSVKDFRAALSAAQYADAILYPIVVIPIRNDAGRNVGGENALTTLSAGTGGHVFTPAVGAELDRAFSDILRELRTQYLIGYYPKDSPAPKDQFHQIRIQLSNPSLRVTTRSGYYGVFEDGTRVQGR